MSHKISLLDEWIKFFAQTKVKSKIPKKWMDLNVQNKTNWKKVLITGGAEYISAVAIS